MKKTIIKLIYTIIVFVVSLFVIGHVTNVETVDMTGQMGNATFPTVSFMENGQEINLLHGYSSEMDVSHIRNGILPIDETRTVSYKLQTYGANITDLRFEVRQVSGNSLVENSEITDRQQDGDAITGTFQLKDLIEADREYMLVVLADTEGKTVRFYTRVIWSEGRDRYHIDDTISFVQNFLRMTFDKEGSQEEITKYIESSAEGDNTSYSHVTIHSSFDQVTWGSLNITEHSEPIITLTDIHKQTACYKLEYQVVQKTVSGDSKKYNIIESYRVRYTSDRIYLLNFDRRMNYIFDVNDADITDNVINMWITEADMTLKESDGGNAFAFVSEGRLYAYNSTDNKIALVFGFYDENHDDIRSTYQGNTINILNVDEAGNVTFAVSGYMNRGDHEGAVGMALYEYESQVNTIEEHAFIPVNYHQDILRAYNKKLLYVSNGGKLFFSLEGDVYMVDIDTREQQKLIENLVEDSYCISDSGSTIAWQENDRKSVRIMNLSTQMESKIEAESGDLIRTLGFMGEDLVYGFVHDADVHSDQMGSLIYGMYRICISDGDGNVLENYTPSGALVTDASIENNVIRLSRATWNSQTQMFESMVDDQIMSTMKTEVGSNFLQAVATDDYKNVLEIMCKGNINTKTLRAVTPNMSLYEGSRVVAIDSERDYEAEPYYYVYGMDGELSVYDDPADAIRDAFDMPGVVVNDENGYVWYRGNLSTSNQIMYITNLAEEWENMPADNSTAVCLDLILQHRGISLNVQSLLDQGQSTLEILQNNLSNAKILELDGCSMEAMLYYVNQDIPVMATLNDGNSVLIIGFNDLNTVLLEPTKGEVYKLGKNDTTALFDSNGNHFVTYLPGEEQY